MANVLDMFRFSLHNELEAVERELVQTVQERLIKEGEAFPGLASKVVVTVEVDLNLVKNSAASCRQVRYELEEA